MNATKQRSSAKKSADRDFVITRTLKVPRAKVFQAWTDPKQMSEWWGPKGFTNPLCQWDARPGNAFRIVMRAPDGAEFPFKGIFREVKEPERLVYTNDTSEHGDQWHQKVNLNRPHAKGQNIDNMITTVTFHEQNGKTLMDIRVSFESAEDRYALLKIGMAKGWSGSLDKLEALLANA